MLEIVVGLSKKLGVRFLGKKHESNPQLRILPFSDEKSLNPKDAEERTTTERSQWITGNIVSGKAELETDWRREGWSNWN